MTRRRSMVLFFLLAVLAFACRWSSAALPATRDSRLLTDADPTPTLSVAPSDAGSPATAGATPTQWPSPTPPLPDSGWETVRPGLEKRVINLLSVEGERLENITIVRVDPTFFRFDVRYRPGEPLDLASWQAQTGADLVVNGGFFTENYEATGLIVVDGEPRGLSYKGFGGMFAVTEGGPELRSLSERPYQAGEALTAALQSFPMLLTPGGVVGIDEDDGQRARRTVVARDQQQRILFMVFSMGHFTLHGLSHALAASDLGLDVALNLDGGTSSGLYLAQPEVFVPAYSLLPSVITVQARPES